MHIVVLGHEHYRWLPSSAIPGCHHALLLHFNIVLCHANGYSGNVWHGVVLAAAESLVLAFAHRLLVDRAYVHHALRDRLLAVTSVECTCRQV